ncbi:MAG: TolC family protein, partial [Candidatus Omnitrophica bacterium]|nr:TolC family protein [Candidatus Omnitrophota bacterium]
PNPVVEGGGKDVSGGDSGLVLGLNQELPMNGSRKLERQAAALRHSAERATLERDVQVVFSEIESAYVDILTAQRLVEVDRRGLEIASDSLRLVSDNYRAGLASSLPLSLAVSERANALKTLKLSEKQVQVARSTLAGLLALDEASLAPISGSLDEPLLPLGLQGGNLDRPDLRAADLKVQAAQSDTHADRRRRIPNPTLGYQREEADDTENFFTIGMEIPIFNSGRLKIQESMASQQVVSKERSALVQTIQTEVLTGSTRLDSAREAVSIYETEIRPSISQSLESAKSAFQSGTTDMSLLLQTQSKLIENERDYIRALQELRDAEIAYKLAIGVRKETVQ